MILLPAIDLIGGRCVRLVNGDFDRETAYPGNPAEALAAFAGDGAREAHLVDLDGAKAREPRQHALFVRLARETSLVLQVAGGFRTEEQVERILDSGVQRVVVGSLAVDSPEDFKRLVARFGPERLVLALDVRIEAEEPMVATHGWLTDSGQTLDSVLQRLPEIRHLLVTDIGRDGTMAGPNLRLMGRIAATYPQIALQSSGGVGALGDLSALRETGAARAIVGKAIWEDRFSVAEGLSYAGG